MSGNNIEWFIYVCAINPTICNWQIIVWSWGEIKYLFKVRQLEKYYLHAHSHRRGTPKLLFLTSCSRQQFRKTHRLLGTIRLLFCNKAPNYLGVVIFFYASCHSSTNTDNGFFLYPRSNLNTDWTLRPIYLTFLPLLLPLQTCFSLGFPGTSQLISKYTVTMVAKTGLPLQDKAHASSSTDVTHPIQESPSDYWSCTTISPLHIISLSLSEDNLHLTLRQLIPFYSFIPFVILYPCVEHLSGTW